MPYDDSGSRYGGIHKEDVENIQFFEELTDFAEEEESMNKFFLKDLQHEKQERYIHCDSYYH
jgi:hypothetical protein